MNGRNVVLRKNRFTKPTRLEILHGQLAQHLRFALRSPKAILSTYNSQGNMGKFGETIYRGAVGKSGVLEHKRGNISETRKDRGKVTTEGL